MVGGSIGAWPFLPEVVAGVAQFQSTLDLLKTYAAATLITSAFGEVGVGNLALHAPLVQPEVDVDETGLGGGDAMLEGVFNQRDEDERSDGLSAVGRDVDGGVHLDVAPQADTHQFDVVANELHLHMQGYGRLLVVI